MNAQDTLFLSTQQPQKKLEIAIVRLLEEGADPSGHYSAYLRKRLRPALLDVIKRGSPRALSNFLRLFHPDRTLLLEAVRLAGRLGRTELTAALMLGSSNPAPSCGQTERTNKPADEAEIPAVLEAKPERGQAAEPETRSGHEMSAEPEARPEHEMPAVPKTRPDHEMQPGLIGLCEKILRLETDRLYDSRPFFGSAAARLSFCPVSRGGIGTDGVHLFGPPGLLIRHYKEGTLGELLLHMTLHCLFLHFLPPAGVDKAAWNQSCDAFVLQQLENMGLAENNRSAPPLDSHSFWFCKNGPELSDHSGGEGGSSEEKPKEKEEAEKSWSLLRAQMPKSRQSRRPLRNRGVAGGSKTEWAILRENGRCDFRSYLRRFTSLSEEMQIDPDSIDPIPYYYGQKYFGNMPLIEPLETGEFAKIQELVIAIDTSGSCSPAVVQRFLDETCSILTDQEYFFSRMRVHLIQCDAAVEDYQLITSREEWFSRSAQIQIRGRGGTDFTPVFTYVEKLRKEGRIRRLKGLLYFTDGDGVYPQTAPDYETAFVFSDRRFLDFRVPGWITPLCLNLSEEAEFPADIK